MTVGFGEDESRAGKKGPEDLPLGDAEAVTVWVRAKSKGRSDERGGMRDACGGVQEV